MTTFSSISISTAVVTNYIIRNKEQCGTKENSLLEMASLFLRVD